MWIAVVMIALFALFAYGVGRRIGYRQGRLHGAAEAPLRLRARALDDGCCPLCGSTAPLRTVGRPVARHATISARGVKR